MLLGHSLPDYLLKEIDNFTSHDSTYVSKAISLARTIIAGVPWRIQTRPSITYPRLFDFMTSLRQSANLPIGAAGFCWGGKPLTLLCDGRTAPNGRTLVDAGYTAHPSYLKVPEDITPLKVPYSVCIGNVDMTMNIDEVKKMEDTLKGVQSIEGRWEVVVVEGAKHGFAVRGDPTKEDEAKQVSSFPCTLVMPGKLKFLVHPVSTGGRPSNSMVWQVVGKGDCAPRIVLIM